jgi:hypothetical protein
MSKLRVGRGCFRLGESQAMLLAEAVTSANVIKTEFPLQCQPEGRVCRCCGAVLSRYNPSRVCHPCQDAAFLSRLCSASQAAAV